MSEPLRRYRVWDLPTRLSHWGLIVLLSAQFASGQFGLLPMSTHLWLGYALLVVVLFRILWGLVGSDSARFSHFLRGPRAVSAYLDRLGSAEPTRWPGHNPIGGWSTVLLLGLTLAQALTGLFAQKLGVLAGPLVHRVGRDTAQTLNDLHGLLHWLLLLLILAHVFAAVYYLLRKRENRIGPIFGSGRLRLPSDPALRFAGAGRALLVLAACVAVVAVIALQAEAQ